MQAQLLLYKEVRKARMFLQLQIANRTICIQHNSTVHSHLQCSHIQYHCFLPRFCCLFSFRQHSGERLIHCLLLTQSSLLPLRCMCTAQKYNGCSVLARQLDAHVEWRRGLQVSNKQLWQLWKVCVLTEVMSNFGDGESDIPVLIRELKQLAQAGICPCVCKVFFFHLFKNTQMLCGAPSFFWS